MFKTFRPQWNVVQLEFFPPSNQIDSLAELIASVEGSTTTLCPETKVRIYDKTRVVHNFIWKAQTLLAELDILRKGVVPPGPARELQEAILRVQTRSRISDLLRLRNLSLELACRCLSETVKSKSEIAYELNGIYARHVRLDWGNWSVERAMRAERVSISLFRHGDLAAPQDDLELLHQLL